MPFPGDALATVVAPHLGLRAIAAATGGRTTCGLHRDMQNAKVQEPKGTPTAGR